MNVMSVVTLCAVLALAEVSSGQDRPAAVALREQAIERLEAGAYGDALVICDEALAADPAYAEAWRTRAALCLYLDDFDGAEEACRTGLGLSPDDLGLRVNLANLHRRRGDLSAAMEEYSAILERDPDDAFALMGRGNAFIDLGDLAAARDAFTALIERDPNAEGAHGNRGYCRSELGDYEGALADIDAEIALTGGEAYNFQHRAIALLRLGRLDDAIRSARRARAKAPSDPVMATSLGILLIRRGDQREAVRILEPYAETDPGAAIWLAYATLCRWEYAEAREACDAILAGGENPLALWIRGLASFALGDVEAARRDHDRARELDPNVHAIWG